MTEVLPAGWTFSVNAFNWTQDVVAAAETASQVAIRIARDVSPVLELEPGQLWRRFPAPCNTEVDAMRDGLAEVGGTVSIVGASIDEWRTPTLRRSPGERLQFLAAQLHAAHRIGATGARLPLGQAGRPLLERVLPLLHELNVTLYEEIQGAQSPQNPIQAAAIETIAGIDDDHVRLLVDTSMLMPALPVTYLQRLEQVGLSDVLVRRLAGEWLDPNTPEMLRGVLADGGVPAAARTLFTNMLTRFGRSSTTDIAPVVSLTGAFHLKFWDLDDANGRVSHPLVDLGALLATHNFKGYLCSEWGGFEWLEGHDASTTTTAHLALAQASLRRGVVTAAS